MAGAESRAIVSSFKPRDRCHEILMATLIYSAMVVVFGVLIWILTDIAVQGLCHINVEFLTQDLKDAGRAGGIGPIIISTSLIVAVTLSIAIPISLATAIELTERIGRESWWSRFIRTCLDILAGVPSIVFGLFGNALFAITLGLGYSILTGGLTLACMVLPLLIRTLEQAIAAVPNDYRYAAAALGLGRTATLTRVILPVAAPAMLAGVVLSIGRALAETAALIFTSGYVTRTPESLLDSGRSLSVHIYDLAMNVPNGGSRAYATACVLVSLLLIINAGTALLLRIAGLSARPALGEGR